MKNVCLVIFAVTVMMFTASAQNLDAAKVPAAVKTSFAKLFPAASVQWGKEGAKYEAEFKVKGKPMSTIFDAKGTLEETETDIEKTELPSKMLAYLKAHYKDKNIQETTKITKANGTVNYEAGVGGKDVIFDTAGNFLKEAKD
ncbi:MAG: hypothetical protein JWP81_1011 [Ferruginibacter sp.]|nr:hypothetical protein [Ferruginibacter sp.]